MSNSILTLERQSKRSNFKSVSFKTKGDVRVRDETNCGFLGLGDNLTPHRIRQNAGYDWTVCERILWCKTVPEIAVIGAAQIGKGTWFECKQPLWGGALRDDTTNGCQKDWDGIDKSTYDGDCVTFRQVRGASIIQWFPVS